MRRLLNKDVFDIFNLFELEFYSIYNLTKTDGMRIRKKLNNILKPALLAPINEPRDIMRLAEVKLGDILTLFRDKDSFLKKLSLILDEKLLTGAEKAYVQIKDLDTKMIRKKFDDIGFSRSSNLRHVLTRILRDSTDAEELLASVNREAKKIVNPEEINVLLQLKEKDHLSFMGEVIHLLSEKVNNKA